MQPTLEQLEAEKARRGRLAELEAEKARRQSGGKMSGQDALALQNLGADPGREPAQDAPAQTNGRNPVSRALNDFAGERALPGLAGDIVSGGARIAGAIADDPVQTLVVDPLTAPTRATGSFVDASKDLGRGDLKKAGAGFIDAATAAGETALLVAPGSGSVAKVGVKQATKKAGRSSQVLDDAARTGIDPDLPSSFPQTAGRIAKPLSENALGGGGVRRAADDKLVSLENAVGKAADEFSPGAAGANDAGQAAREGLQRFNKKSQITPDESSVIKSPSRFSTFRDKAEALYNRAYRSFDADGVQPLPNTQQALSGVNSRFGNEDLQQIFDLPTASRLQSSIGEGGLSIADMRALRTEIRDLQNKGKFLQTRDDAALAQLEGALTQDIYAAVSTVGGKSALQQLQRADKFYGRGIERIRTALEPFLRDKATDETAFRSILNAARGQGKGDVKRLRALRRALKPDEMDDISAGVLREMGKAKEGGDFSPEVFSRAWQTMGDDAKAALFNRAQRPEVRENLDALARVIDRQAGVERLSNRSQSGVSLQNAGTLVAIGAEPMTAIAAIIGANALGRLMMSPAFTKAVLKIQMDAPRIAQAGAVNARERARIIGALSVAENSDASIAPIIQDLKAAANDNSTPPETQVRQK